MVAARQTSYSVSYPLWTEVWIVARGPSANVFDYRRLAGKQVLIVNNFLIGSDPSAAICSADTPWVDNHRAALADYVGEVFLAHWGADVAGTVHLARLHEDGLSNDPASVCTGGNSGYMALNVAWHKCAKLIHLVGFDMTATRGADAEKFREWVPRFRDTLPQFAARGVKVINHNMASAIDAFEKVA